MSPDRHLKYVVNRDVHLEYLLRADHGHQTWSLCFIHDQPRLTSTIDIAIVASGAAKVNLSALVSVTAAASNTQTSLNIHVLTTDQACVTAAPNLELMNQNVQASHSLSTHHLSRAELFYLASRGITAADARTLLIDSVQQRFQDAQQLT